MFALFAVFALAAATFKTDRPVIGIVASPNHASPDGKNDGSTSYTVAQLVKFVEMGGAIAVPINIMSNTDEEIIELMSKLNGVFMPGGWSVLVDPLDKLTYYGARA
jgi:gamma-glutamyl-gamma-aminobutyrate hydrolase PuuD